MRSALDINPLVEAQDFGDQDRIKNSPPLPCLYHNPHHPTANGRAVVIQLLVASPIKAWRCWGIKDASRILPFSREQDSLLGLHRIVLQSES